MVLSFSCSYCPPSPCPSCHLLRPYPNVVVIAVGFLALPVQTQLENRRDGGVARVQYHSGLEFGWEERTREIISFETQLDSMAASPVDPGGQL